MSNPIDTVPPRVAASIRRDIPQVAAYLDDALGTTRGLVATYGQRETTASLTVVNSAMLDPHQTAALLAEAMVRLVTAEACLCGHGTDTGGRPTSGD